MFSNSEAASYIGVKPNTLAIWRCTKRYDIPYLKIGKLVKYRKSDLDLFLYKHSKSKK